MTAAMSMVGSGTGGGTARTTIPLSIGSNSTSPYNIFSNKGGTYVAGLSDINLTITAIQSSNTIATAALDTGTGWTSGDTITIILTGGTITGAAGASGTGGTVGTPNGGNGGNGGDAFNMRWAATTFTGSSGGTIGGGGGGGGGGAFSDNVANGGNGGSGAGSSASLLGGNGAGGAGVGGGAQGSGGSPAGTPGGNGHIATQITGGGGGGGGGAVGASGGTGGQDFNTANTGGSPGLAGKAINLNGNVAPSTTGITIYGAVS